MGRSVIVGSRASALALAQTRLVVATLEELHPGIAFEIQRITTRGDRVLHRPLSKVGGKGLFVRELEEVLLAGQIDLAVHSLKDLPTEQPAGLLIAAVPQRADPRDALVTRDGHRLADLPPGARVGTSSLRRMAQLRALRPDLEILDIRGNVDTRLRKLDEGRYDAIILAAAGLARLGLSERVAEFLDPETMLPAPGQGALAVEARVDDPATRALVEPLDHHPTRLAVEAERAFLRRLGGGCQVPMAAHAWLDGDSLRLRGMVADVDGSNVIYAVLRGPASRAADVGVALAEEILTRRDYAR